MGEATLLRSEFDSLQVALLARLARDRAVGRGTSLADCLALSPGREEVCARTWLAVRGATPADAAQRTEDACPAEGATMLGPYRLLGELGRGGQAIVWRAEDTRIGRLVALKTVPRSPLFGELAPRLQREAEALARLEHPGLSPVYDVGSADGAAWIAMRLEHGRTLHERIKSEDVVQRSAAEIVGWIEEAARALHAAHEAGFLHRDVKPSNLMVREDGGVVLLDFGISTSASVPGHLTLTGDAVGTPAYMAPEVLAADRGPVDRRADIWSLGVTLYESLTGKRPFEAVTGEAEVRRALREEPAPIDPVRARGLRRPDLQLLLRTALAKEPTMRYLTAGALAEDLRRLKRGEPLAMRPPSALRRARLWARRRPSLAAALAVLVLFAVTSATLFLRSERQLRDIRRLADLAIARDLIAARSELFPISSELAPKLGQWVTRTDELLSRGPSHRAILERLPTGSDRLWAERDEAGDGWLREQVVELLATLEELRVLRAFMAPQAALARDLERLNAVDHAAAWEAAAARVSADPRFSDFELSPRHGLAPLGPDPTSGLEEFAHLPTGAAARRSPTTGLLTRDDATGIVLVLVPFGETLVGCSDPALGSEHPDPGRCEWDGPLQRVRLDPYLISKYEVTQAQWTARTGANPSRHQRARGTSRFITGDSRQHPVENVTLEEWNEVLQEMGLALPTEVQWEHSARAGSGTPWSFGADPTVFGQYGNIADETAGEINHEVGWTLEPGVTDGHVVHAPVGSFGPNPWGLHDVHGNVGELTRSTYEDLASVPPRDGDGATSKHYDLYVPRGGSYNVSAACARSSYRMGQPPDVRSPWVGARPILPYGP